MIALLINTASDQCEAAVATDDRVSAWVREPMTHGHDVHLAGIVERVMREAGVALGGLDRIGVVTGPGSFTGLRVGVAFARGLGVATGAPVHGVTSLEACVPRDHSGPLLVALPARRRAPDRSWWVQAFDHGAATSEACECDEAQLLSLAQGMPVTGEGLPEGLALQPLAPLRGARLAGLRVAQAMPASLSRPSPVYVREPDAQPQPARPH